MWEQPCLLCVRDKDFIHPLRTNTTTLCPPLPSSFPLWSFLLAFVALTSPPPPFSLHPSLFCPASPLMWTKWKGKRLVQGCDLALLTPTHSTALRGSQQSENHVGARMQTIFTRSEGRGEKNPFSTASSCNKCNHEYLIPIEVLSGWNWVCGGDTGWFQQLSSQSSHWTVSRFRIRDWWDCEALSRHAHSSLRPRGVQWSKNTSLSAGKKTLRSSKWQQILYQSQHVKYDVLLLMFTVSLDQTSELKLWNWHLNSGWNQGTIQRKTKI